MHQNYGSAPPRQYAVISASFSFVGNCPLLGMGAFSTLCVWPGAGFLDQPAYARHSIGLSRMQIPKQAFAEVRQRIGRIGL